MKIRAIFLNLIFLLLSFTLQAHSIEDVVPLSDTSFISVLTCDPGTELYSTFGHSAIRVFDPKQDIDWVFNYGTFTFNTPNFYVKFVSGKLLYKLSIGPYHRFINIYLHEGRMVTEDKLDLTSLQKQNLFNLLLENYQPENRNYQYDFFFDNCATRITDILHKALKDSLVSVPSNNTEIKTFRNLIDEYLTKSDWSDFGIDVALGAVIDKPASEFQKTFLPDYLHDYLINSLIAGKPLVSDTKIINESTLVIPETPWIISPQLWFWVLFIVIVLLTIIYHKKSWVIGDRIIFGTWGLVGVIILLLWVATDHDATASNLNILWANPLYLLYIFVIGSKNQKTLKWSSLAVFILNASVIAGWFWIPQQYNIVFIPIIGTLIIRSAILFVRAAK